MDRHDHQQPAAPAPAGHTRLRAVLMCLVDDPASAVAARALLPLHGGEPAPDADGVLAVFERPVQAVAFALACQRALRAAAAAPPPRIGIHVGDIVFTDPHDAHTGTVQVDPASQARLGALRLARLARPGQVLLSGIAHALALRARDELGGATAVRWRSHGRWRFDDGALAWPVHEVGEAGLAPLKAPLRGLGATPQRRWFQHGIARAAMLVLAAAAGVGVLQAMLATPAELDFAGRDWVLVADLQNLTGEPRYGTALEGAFRIGLERSRHVNMIPESRIADALQRMQRPVDTPLDRDVSIEVAVREGARAVIVPTVADVGGRLRVSVQVVDPASGVTVFGASADGSGDEGALAALDEVVSILREDLGESLAGIASTSEPLERVTSPDLEALRAYTLGVRAAERGQPEQANALFVRALDLDPGFAAAHARLAAYHLQAGDRASAWRHVQAADAERERLGARDRLYVDGYRAFFGTPEQMLARWSEFATRYPDAAVAHHNLGFVHLVHRNDFANAAVHFERAARTPHSAIASSQEVLATTLLAQDRIDDAMEWIEKRHAIGRPPILHAEVDLQLALRDLAAAAAALDDRPHNRYRAGANAHALRQAVLAVEQGQPGLASQTLEWLEAGLAGEGQGEARARALLARIAVEAWTRGNTPADLLHTLLRHETRRLEQAGESHDYSAVNHLLIAAVLAARAGEPALARAALEPARDFAEGSGFPDREAWLAAARAELALAEGAPERALEAIRPALAIDLYYAHVLMLRVHLANRALDAALAEAEWLEGHRGHMLGEFLALHSALLLNVTATSEALVAVAQAAHDAGEPATARRLLAPLAAGWQDADGEAAPVRRAKALQAP